MLRRISRKLGWSDSFALHDLCGPALVLAGLMSFAVMVVLLWPFTVDDTYIALRYAKNWVEGGGLTWNYGSVPIEGYTSILWIALLTIPHHLIPWPVVGAKVLSLISALGLFAVTFLFAKRVAEHSGKVNGSFAAAVSVLFVAAWPPTAVHAVSGMETTCFALLLSGFFYALTAFTLYPGKEKSAVLAVMGLLVGLTRPEGNLAVVVGFLSAFVVRGKIWDKDIMKSLALWYVLPFFAYFLWRMWYYHHFFPLSFYIKVTGEAWFAGKFDVLMFFVSVAGPLGLLCVIAATRLPTCIFPACISALSLVVFYLFPAHIMNYDFRFLYPVFPLTAVIASIGLGCIAAWLDENVLSPGSSSLKCIVILFALSLVVPFGFLEKARDVLRQRLSYARGLEAAHIRLAKHLLSLTKENGQKLTLAVGDAGAIPYISGLRTIDTFGLNDPTIAVSGARTPGYIFSHKPDIVILLSRNELVFRPLLSWEEDLFSECKHREMVKLETLRFADDYYLWVMGTPHLAWPPLSNR